MSQEDSTKGNIPLSSDDHADEATSTSSWEYQDEFEGTEDSGSYFGSELPWDDDKPLEGATGIEMDDDLINAGKDDVFKRFLSGEYDQSRSILYRRRHRAERQRRISNSSNQSVDSSLLEQLQLFKLTDKLVLNQAGAIVGTMPARDPELIKRSLSGFGYIAEDSDPSIGGAETVLIGDVYAGNFSPRQSSDSSRGLSPASSFPSFSSRPPTAASGDIKESEQPYHQYFEGCKQSHELTGLEPLPRDKQERQRRFGVIHHEAIRSNSAPVAQLPDADDKLQKRKVSKDFSVRSEPLTGRKVSKDSSVDSFEGMVYQEEVINYPHSVESDSCISIPDLEGAAAESGSCLPMPDLKEGAAAESGSCLPMPDLKKGAAAESGSSLPMPDLKEGAAAESGSCLPMPHLKEGAAAESGSCLPMPDLKEGAAAESDSSLPMPDLKEGAAAESDSSLPMPALPEEAANDGDSCVPMPDLTGSSRCGSSERGTRDQRR